MTIPLTCILVAYALVFLPRVFVVVAQSRDEKGYDNRDPREQQARLTAPWAKRASAAHANAFEAFAPFAAAVLVAHVAGADPTWATILALVHVGARTIYPFLYVAGIGTARSLVWMVGTTATAALMALPWIAPA
ncbi:MAG: MAPEG family protein [Deltaproteobacteria bacterium]|nr:MAPEG family protein [Deltaproteobacteria bacterium]